MYFFNLVVKGLICGYTYLPVPSQYSQGGGGTVGATVGWPGGTGALPILAELLSPESSSARFSRLLLSSKLKCNTSVLLGPLHASMRAFNSNGDSVLL